MLRSAIVSPVWPGRCSQRFSSSTLPKILIVEDDLAIAATLTDALSAADHLVDAAHNTVDAEGFLTCSDYDLIVLDWGLPDGTGYDLCVKWRRENKNTPILFLTAKDDVDAKVQALNAGGADYLTKPFDIREFIARTRALLRRPSGAAEAVTMVADIELNSAEHSVKKAGAFLKLQPLELSILELLARSPNTVFSVEELQVRSARSREVSSRRAVYESVRRLRLALDSVGTQNLIETVAGQGYVLRD